jgi:hypothetical protein
VWGRIAFARINKPRESGVTPRLTLLWSGGETHRQTKVSKNRAAPLDQKVYSFLKTAVRRQFTYDSISLLVEWMG